ncbi:MAG TPA: acyl-CoA reductase, partial [Thermoanaerobaculia bacterium]|nr:acyl-CoA reductase [Thermoanaerobaculia bacterium]
MLPDLFLPAGIEPPPIRWTPEALARIVAALADRGGEALAAVGEAALLAAWAETVEAFRAPASPERRALDPSLARLCRLSPEGLAAGLEAVLGGVREGPAAALFARARNARERARGAGPVLAVLAANLPALAVQPLLPALALGRPVFLKSPSAEPLFAPAFLAALSRREPRLGAALAAAAWPGGDPALEEPVLAAVGTVLAYGGQEALDDLERRAPGKVVRYGPQTSLAVVAADVADADLEAVARGLARDVALFDQRGCLSIAAVYLEGTPADAEELAARLAAALAELARLWPPGPPEPGAAGAVQQLRLAAEMRGLSLHLPHPPYLPLAAGTVIVEPEPAFHPSPGLRTVRVHPLADLGR